jgi:hypothetical protein
VTKVRFGWSRYGGIRLSDHALLINPPKPPGAAISVCSHGVDYVGVGLSVTVTAEELYVERLSANSGVGPSVVLQITSAVGGGAPDVLHVGVSVSLPRAGGASVSVVDR